MTDEIFPNHTQNEFIRWLAENGRSFLTAVAYAGHVKRAMNVLGRQPEENDFARYLDVLPAAARNQVRTAWRAWAEYAASKGVEVPQPPTRSRGRPRLPAGPLDLYAHAILAAGVRPQDLVTMRWSDVRPGVAEMTLQNPARTRSWQVPKALVLALKEHVFGAGHVAPGAFLFAHADKSPWEVADLLRAASRVEQGVLRGETQPWQPPAA